jgi:anti-sigma regulatory factor (Ser/Thr protein kinase)
MTGFKHEALLYAGQQEFLAGTVPFVRDGIQAGEPTMVATSRERIAALQAALGDVAEHVLFADMAELGANPARIIPAWRDFVADRSGPVRGIGEPVWPGRTPAELVECRRHEQLLNLAFADAPGFTLLCPYDTARLDPAAIEGAHETHPTLVERGASRPSAAYTGLTKAAAPFSEPLPEPSTPPAELTFDRASLSAVRTFVVSHAHAAGLSKSRTVDLMLAVSELAANSVKYAGGEGLVRIWREQATLICEVRDGGRIDEPLAGRERPQPGQSGGYGMWLVNQVCELVQVRSFATGSVVRLHMQAG